MATGIRCPRCEVLNRTDVQACRACGAALPKLRVPQSVAASTDAPTVVGPAPAPASPPRILRPAPLKPPSLEKLPPAAAAPPRARAPAPAPVSIPEAPAFGGGSGAARAEPVAKPPPAPKEKARVDADAAPAPVAAPATTLPETPVVVSSSAAARRAPTARAPTPPPQRPAARARAATQAVVVRPTGHPTEVEAGPRVRVASLWRVTLAALIDGALSGGAAVVITALAAPLVVTATPKTEGVFGLLELVLMSPSVLAIFAGSAVVVSVFLQSILLPAAGATVGGLLLGVRVITRSSGQAPGPGRAALRAVAGTLGALFFLVGPLWALWLDPLRRSSGDLASGTLPVRR